MEVKISASHSQVVVSNFLRFFGGPPPDVSCMGLIRDPVGRPTGSFNSRRIWLVCPEKSKSGFLSSTVELVRQMNPRSRVYVHTPPRFELS